MKKTLLTLASSLGITLVLAGCFQNETTIHLNQDGSGTLVEETRFGAQTLAMLDQMAALGGETATEDPVQRMFSEAKAKTRATELGEGVAFEKSEAILANGSKGARVTYRFKDINKLKIEVAESMKKMSPMGAMGEVRAPAAKKADPIVFSYSAGTLTVKMPQAAKPGTLEIPAGEGSDKPDMDNPEGQAMLKQMLGDMTMSLKVVVEPGIAETNATYLSGNTITLLEMDMSKLLENADTLKQLGKVDPKDTAAAMEALKAIKGVKFETQQAVTVKIR